MLLSSPIDFSYSSVFSIYAWKCRLMSSNQKVSQQVTNNIPEKICGFSDLHCFMALWNSVSECRVFFPLVKFLKAFLLFS